MIPNKATFDDLHERTTFPREIGLLINGVELLSSPLFDENIYYGGITSIDVTNAGEDYDVVDVPPIEIKDDSGTGVKAHVNLSGTVREIKILNSGIIDPPGILEQIPLKHKENIIAFAANIIEETVKTSKKANQIQIYKFLSQLKEYLSDAELSNLGISPSDNFVKSQLVLAMSHGVTLTLRNNDFMGLADKVINELFHTNMLMD